MNPIVTISSNDHRDPNVEELAERWWVLAIRGVAAIGFGLCCLIAPGLSLFALVMLFAAYALVDGVANLVMGFRSRRRPIGRRWGWLVFEGLVSIAAGAVAFLWPRITALVLVFVVATWSVLTGGAALAAAIRLRKRMHGEWLLGLAGVLSIGLGVLLLLFPGPGLVALVLWIGAYSIAAGVLLVALSLRLRAWIKRTQHHLPTGGGAVAT